jgi:hypothetical protein
LIGLFPLVSRTERMPPLYHKQPGWEIPSGKLTGNLDHAQGENQKPGMGL